MKNNAFSLPETVKLNLTRILHKSDYLSDRFRREVLIDSVITNPRLPARRTSFLAGSRGG